MTLKVREMEIDDIPATFAVRLSTVENAVTMAELEERDYGVTPHSLSEAMKSHVKGWVSEDAASIVGFAMGDRSNGEVLVVAVRPEYERKGIGKSLLSEQHDEIWLLANPDPHVRATGFYRKLGWQATGTFMGSNEVLKLGKGKNPIANTPTNWTATISTSASEQDQ
jgi:ribosomal protein S18 acetylase RimI-like enzyme